MVKARKLPTGPRYKWPKILVQAKAIVGSYDTGVTLRQLFYQLVAKQIIRNEEQAYKSLSDRTAKGRRAGTFPDLIDEGRAIHRFAPTFTTPEDALNWLHGFYRRDRTEGQEYAIYLGVEKKGMLAQLDNWFGALGIPILPLGGFASQSYIGRVRADVMAAGIRDTVLAGGKPGILIYAGDFDASGEAIYEDFVNRTNQSKNPNTPDCWAETIQVALSEEQVEMFGLPRNPGKEADSRSKKFIAKYGHNDQVELDALDPRVLRQLYLRAVKSFYDEDALEAVLEQEERDRGELPTYYYDDDDEDEVA